MTACYRYSSSFDLRFGAILLEANLVHHALQEILAGVRFDYDYIGVTRSIPSVSQGDIEIALNHIQDPGTSIRDLSSFQLITALLLLGHFSDRAFQEHTSVDQIDASIKYRRLATLLIPNCHLDKSRMINHLGNLHQTRYDLLGEVPDIDAVIAYQTRAIQLISDKQHVDAARVCESAISPGSQIQQVIGRSVEFNRQIHQATYLSELAIGYKCRFYCLNELEDIDQAILYASQAIELTPDGHPGKAMCLSTLGASHRMRFDCQVDLSDIDRAIACQTAVVELIPDGDLKKPSSLNCLGDSHRVRFTHCREVLDINQAILYLDQAVGLISEDHPDRAGYLGDLGNSHRARYDRLAEVQDIDRAISLQNKVIELTPSDHSSKAGCFQDLGDSYWARFTRLNELPDLDQAIAYLTQAAEHFSKRDLDKPEVLYSLGSAHRARYGRLGQPPDIIQAVVHLKRAVEIVSDDDPDKGCYLTDLGNWCRLQSNRTQDPAILDQGINYLRQALKLTPNGHPGEAVCFHSLGLAYGTRVDAFGQIRREDMDQTVTCFTRAVELTPNSRFTKVAFLTDLAHSHANRYSLYRDLSDIDQAITYRSQVVMMIAADHPGKALRLANLGSSYAVRFERLAELSDINQGIMYLTQAMDLASDDDPAKPYYLNDLGAAYRDRFTRFSDPSDIDQAISYQVQAVDLTPSEHPSRPSRLSLLGNSYEIRFTHFRKLSDVNQAIGYLNEAIEITPNDHPTKTITLSDLGVAYRDRFEHQGNISDIDQAIEFQTRATQLILEGQLEDPKILYNLGKSYWRRFVSQGTFIDLESANSCFQKSAELPLSDPRTQLQSADLWSSASLKLGVSPCSAYEKAMEIVPNLIWLGAQVHQRYELLIDVGNIVLKAAAWAISVADYDLALEWLEQGRSIVWNQILQLRTPFDDISISDATLSQDLQRVARELGAAGLQPAPLLSPMSDPSQMEEQNKRRHLLASEWERLLIKARGIPGFEDFMYPRKASQLKSAATSGPVILINVHSSRCDALAILPGAKNVAHIPLPTFTVKKAKDAQSNLLSAIGDRGSRTRHYRPLKSKLESGPLKATLMMLWFDIVKPVLSFLGYIQQLPIDELPHLTWCTTGPLSFLPLHAAGCYNGSEPDAMDLVISSYTPTLSALLDGRSSGSTSVSNSVIAVGQEQTPGLDPLPNTALELSVIKKLASGLRFTELNGADASVNAVLDAMEQHSCVHLACHATQNPDNPAHSTFHLFDGGLTLEAITNRAFRNKTLAFLSACQTAAGDDKRPDESIHLAAGMLMAGYPSVIATMWSIWDEDGPEIASSVYAELIKDGKMDFRDTARALHTALAKLRAKIGQDAFKRWVPFVHIGL